MARDAASILLGLTGLHIDGGVAAVARCMTRALEGACAAGRAERVDRVLLLEDPARAAPAPCGEQLLARGSQPRFVWELWRSFRRHRHDLVLLDHVGLAHALMLPLPGYPPPRFAIFVHGIELEAADAGPRARALQRAEVLLANSEFTAQTLRRRHPALAERIRVVQLCIDPERTDAWSARVRDEAQRREPAALIVGRMWAEQRGKGHDALLEAWPRVRAGAPKAELWIAGEGDDAPRLQARARDLGVGEAVRFLGRVSDEQLADLYTRAALFAMPSRQEGFGLTYAEAMWFGLPCLASTADAAGQVVVDGETGVLVPYGDAAAIADALVQLLADPARARRLGEAGRRRAHERFTFERFERDLLGALGLGAPGRDQ